MNLILAAILAAASPQVDQGRIDGAVRKGAKMLLDAQKEGGSWAAGGGRSNATGDSCYAILFLKKATQKLVASEDHQSK